MTTSSRKDGVKYYITLLIPCLEHISYPYNLPWDDTLCRETVLSRWDTRMLIQHDRHIDIHLPTANEKTWFATHD